MTALKLYSESFTVRGNLILTMFFVNPDTSSRYYDLKRSFNSALKKAGIRDFHFHDLRHTCASWLVMAGVDLRAVAEILGHKTIRMTMRYSHLSPDHLQKTVSVFDKLISTDTLTDTVSQSN